MIYNLTVVTLSGCEFCNRFKRILNDENIRFKELVCDKDPGFCDDVEYYTGCDLYPMVIVNTSTGLRITLCLTNDYQKINTTKQLNDKTGIIYLHSIDTMLDYIKKI